MTNQINEENIRVAAYYIWEQAGRPEGVEKECWIKACEQLFAAKKPAAKKSSSAKPAAKPAAKSTAKTAVKSEKVTAKPAAKKPAAKKSSSAKPAAKAEPFYGIRK